MYKVDSVFDNLQWLMCYKTKPNNLRCFFHSAHYQVRSHYNFDGRSMIKIASKYFSSNLPCILKIRVGASMTISSKHAMIFR